MGNILVDMLDGIDECPNCKSKKFRIETTSFGYVDLEKDDGWDSDEQDTSIFCDKCGEKIE